MSSEIQESDLKIKIVFVGDIGSGKTNIKNRFCRATFSEYSNPTIGIQLSTRKFWGPFEEHENLYSAVCWDIGAANKDEAVMPSYFRNALGVVYVYDVTKEETFEKLEEWRDFVVKFMNHQNYTEMILGNKTDLFHFKEVKTEEVQKWAIMKRIRHFYEISALQNLYIEEAMHSLIKSIVEKFDETVKRPVRLDRKEAYHRGCL